jgi:GxxExxY protein
MGKPFHKTDKLDPELERIASIVVDAAYKLHSTLGPGLLEGVYETFFLHELKLRGLKAEKQGFFVFDLRGNDFGWWLKVGYAR